MALITTGSGATVKETKDKNGNQVFYQLDGYGDSKGSSSGGSSSGSSSNSNPYLSNLINSQYDSALKSKVAALQKARDTSISGYNQNIQALPGEYQPLRNQADLRGMQNSRAISETMAAQGNWRSGANQTAQTANNASTANTIGGYNKQQQDAVDRLKQAIAQVNAGYQSDIATTTADTLAQRDAALISQANQDRSFNQQDKQFNMNFGLQSQTANANNAMTYAQLDEMRNPSSVTNQMKQIGLDTARLNYQALPDQLKSQAQKIAQDLAMGNISQQAAQLQLDYLPQQLQLGLAQTQAQINASNRAGTSGGSSASNLSAMKYANELGSQQALASSMQGLQSMASDGKTRSEILKFINTNAADLQANGVPVQDLYSWANKNFTWDKQNGEWYNTAEDD
jgi:hypothetical protein